MNLNKTHQLVRAACQHKHLSEKSVKTATIAGPDLFLTLTDGETVRVELSALPALILESLEAPEPAPTAEPLPVNTRAQAAPGGPAKAKKGQK